MEMSNDDSSSEKVVVSDEYEQKFHTEGSSVTIKQCKKMRSFLQWEGRSFGCTLYSCSLVSRLE